MTYSRKAWLFLLFTFAILFLWLALGPVAREVTVNILNKFNQKSAAAYVDSA